MPPPAKRRRLDLAAVPEPPRRSARLSDRRQRMASPFRLPFDVLLIIFAFLTSPADRKAALLTCKEWYAAMNHPSLWRDSCIVVRKASHPLYLWRLLEAREIPSVIIRISDEATDRGRSWYATLRKLEKVAPPSVTHLSVCEPPYEFVFENISGPFAQLPHLKSLSLESYYIPMAEYLKGLKSHHLLNITELKLSQVGYCYDIDFVGLYDGVGAKLQHLSLQGFHICKRANGTPLEFNDAVIEIDRLPALVSLELINCWSYASGPLITKITDGKKKKYSQKFCLTELRIVRTASVLRRNFFNPMSSFPDLGLGYHVMLPSPVISSRVLCQLRVLEVSNYELFSLRALCRHWHGKADCLQELNLSCNSFSEYGLITIFSNAPQLKSVNLNNNKIGSSLLKSSSFSCLPLESLMVAHSRLPVAKLPKFFPQLVTLDVSGCSRMDDSALRAMVKLKKLRTLIARDSGLTHRAVEKFRVLMKNKPRVLLE